MCPEPEELPTEIWIELFQYLEVNDIYRAFTNLNKYFDDILACHQLLFKVKLKTEENDNISYYQTCSLVTHI